MELVEIEEEEKNNAPIDIDDDVNYDNTCLFCEEDDDEDYDFCSGCDENPFALIMRTYDLYQMCKEKQLSTL